VDIEQRNFQNLSFKTGKTLQWVLERENFPETVSFASLPRLPVEGRKFSSKIFGQNGLS